MSYGDAVTITSEGDVHEVLNTLYRLLDCVANRDKEDMKQLLVPGGSAVQSRDHQVVCTPFRDFPDLMPDGTSRLEERFHEPLVRVDDDIAMVWAHYDFLVDGEIHHWGTNILSFMKQDGRWRVSSVTDNGRTGPCPAHGERHPGASR